MTLLTAVTSLIEKLFKEKYAAIFLITLLSEVSLANENSLSFSNVITLNSNNNFLWKNENEESREGIFIEPSLRYQSRTQNKNMQLGLSYSLEQYNKEFHNTQNPSANLIYNIFSEKNKFGIQLLSQRQSSRTTEISNTGELQEQLSEKNIANALLTLGRAVSPTDSIEINISGLNIQYESVRLVDYNLFGIDLSWLKRLSSTLAIVSTYKANNYQAEFYSYFPITGEIIDNITIVPNTPISYGQAITDSVIQDINIGINWDISTLASISLRSGLSRVDTKQEIITPEQSVELKFPLSGVYLFDAKRTVEANEHSSSHDLNIRYSQLHTKYILTAHKGTKVSDVGSIQDSQSLQLSLTHKASRTDEVGLVLNTGELKLLDDDVVSLEYLRNREYYQATFSWNRILSDHWTLASNITFFGHQYNNIDIDAKGLSGSLSITYHPNSKIW